jgi:hypothetical protein
MRGEEGRAWFPSHPTLAHRGSNFKDGRDRNAALKSNDDVR